MTEKDIKAIPRYIMDKIYRRDLKIEPWQTSTVRYYAYLTVWKKELVKVTVAVANIQNKHWACKQVAVHGVHSKLCFVKDMEYNYFGFGYRVGWYAEELQSQQKQFEDGRWHTADKKYYDPYAPLINRSVVGQFPEYKYSAYQFYKGRDIINYLRIYEEYPQTEYLLKLGLGAYAENRSLLKKLVKDKAFCKWMMRSRKELALPYGNAYNITTITQAYKTGLPLREVSHFLFRKKQFERDASTAPIREAFPGCELKKYFDYAEKYNISERLYLDYLNACKHLGIDMTLKQNLYPKDFTYAHDLRTQQYAEQKAIEEAGKKQELIQKFSEVAEKYSPLQHNKRSAFICVIAKSPADLIREGELMHHCVGRMQYDERFAKEQSLIFFIRAKEKPEKPLVTLDIRFPRIKCCNATPHTIKSRAKKFCITLTKSGYRTQISISNKFRRRHNRKGGSMTLHSITGDKFMRNYIEELYTVSEFKRDNPQLSDQAEKALQYLKGHCPNSEGDTFVVIEVEGYHCIAYLTDEFAPYTLGTTIAPFDKDRIYPLQGLVTKYAFKRY